MRTLVRRVLAGAACEGAMRTALASGRAPIPLLVFRLPEFAEIAWRDGKRAAQSIERATVQAFARAAERMIRDGDLLAHESTSDWFVVAMLSPARARVVFGALDARAALERIGTAMSAASGRRIESGWCTIERAGQVDEFRWTREQALARGARERERFEFLATVGHELRTPLTSIRGYIETLLDDELDPKTNRRFLETARREALRLTRLVDRMLEFSLLDLSSSCSAGVDVAEVARAAVETLHPIARDAGVSIAIRSAERALARIDGDGCMHALLNVVENAIKYARAGGRVEIGVEREAPFVRILVDDDGPGVLPGDRERIFAYRERGAAPPGVAGKGVGLSIVRTIVDRAGGRVEVARSPLGGARFIVALPLVKAEPAGNSS